MKNIIFLSFLLINYTPSVLSQVETGSFVDSRDGQVYNTVKIGNQWWMAENLAYLPTVSPGTVGSSAESHYYVYAFWGSDLNIAKSSTYYINFGALYNWHAALESCPVGWHLPSDDEWTELSNFLGGESIAGDKMKEVGYDGWSGDATNESGFTALPAGIRSELGGFGNGYIWMWSSSANDASSAWRRILSSEATLYRGSSNMASGFSIRCVKNNIQNQPPNKPLLLTPLNGSAVSAPFSLTWSCSDPDGDQLNYILYVKENGGNWESETIGAATKYDVSTYDGNIDLTYDWYIVASDGTDNTTSDIWQFTLKGSAPVCSPSLISPTSGAVLDNGCDVKSDPLSWNFDWQDCEGASKYNIYVYNTSMASPLIDIDGLETSVCNFSQIVSIDYNNLTGWKWKVRAMVNNTWGPWSEERPFTVEPVNTDCPQISECTPILVSPNEGDVLDNGCSDLSDLITWNFDWQDCIGASKYHLYAKHSSAVNPVIDNQNIISSQYNYNNYGSISINFSSQWIWKVRAMVNGEWGPWSEERAFNVEKANSDCSTISSINAEVTNIIVDKQIITKGAEIITAKVTIRNSGNLKGTFKFQASSITGNGPWNNWISSNESLTLDPGASGNIIFTWNPDLNVLTGNYGINVKIFKSNIINDLISEKWFPNLFNVVDNSFNLKVLNISLNNYQFIKNKEQLESTITIKNESNKSGIFNLKTTIKNAAYLYTCNTQDNIPINPYEIKRIKLIWIPNDQIISGQYNFTAVLTDPGSNNELHYLAFSTSIKIYDFDAEIKIENFILNNANLSQPKIIWTNENDNMLPVKICADGSTSTLISFYDKSNSYDINNIRFKLKNDPNTLNSNVFGKFLNYTIVGKKVIVEYQHPDYVEEKFKPFRSDTILIVDISKPNLFLSKIPLQIYRAPVLLVHGLWGDVNSMFQMEGYLKDYYTWNISRANYRMTNDATFEVNKSVIPSAINSLFEKLRYFDYSAGKVDIVAHSMGGVLSRKYLNEFNRQDVHKLITLNSPFFGSQFANLLRAGSENSRSINILSEALKAMGMNSEKGAVEDLKVDSKEIRNLSDNFHGQWVPSHAITSTFDDPVNIPSSGSNKFEYDMVAGNILGWTFLYNLHNGPHDVIVALKSQEGGLKGSAISPFDRISHQTIKHHDDAMEKVLELLSFSSKNTEIFDIDGFAPQVIPPKYKSTYSESKLTDEGCINPINDSVIIKSPLNNLIYYPGDTFSVEIETENNINHLMILFSNYYNYVSIIDTIASDGIFHFAIPEETFDSLNIMAIGFLDECAIDYDNVTIKILNTNSLDSLSYYPKSVIVAQESYEPLIFTAYYKEGFNREININDSKYIRYEITDTTIASIKDVNLIYGNSLGFTSLNICYGDTSFIIPIQVVPGDTNLINYNNDTTKYTDIWEIDYKGIDTENGDFLLYPNPSKGYIWIDLKKHANSIIKIFSTNGIELVSIELPDNKNVFEINLSNLPKGIYFITFKNSNFIKTKKIIIQ